MKLFKSNKAGNFFCNGQRCL